MNNGNEEMNTEEILNEDNNRYCLFPIKYNDIWKEYKTQLASFWTPEEIDYLADKNDWDNLSSNEKYFIEHILAFFAGSDGIVLENLVTDFCQCVKIPEARAVYSYQALIENVHSHTYALLIDTYIDDEEHKLKLFKAIETIPCVKRKADWAIKWIDKTQNFATRLIAFSIVEGIFFSGSFCAIFWLKSRGKMTKSLGTSNELIARDESMHVNFAVLLYSKIKNRVKSDTFYFIMKEAVDIEINFICESLPCDLIGMNKNLMGDYIKFVSDRLSIQLGYEKIYNIENPFQFMESISLDGKTNFFEKRVTEYQLSSQTGKNEFILDDNF